MSDHAALVAWLAWWRGMQRYHRYRVEGLHHLDSDDSLLLVGYHGRPIAHDQCMLSVSLYDRYGYLPHGVIHGAVDDFGPLRWMKDGLGFVTSDGPDLDEAVTRGEHLAVQPGGTREGCRSVRHRYQVDWGGRIGWVRLALRLGVRVVPVGGWGMDDTYLGLNDGYRTGRRLGAPSGLPVWVGLGPLGAWPFSPPFPVRVTTRIGAPIDLWDHGRPDPSDTAALAAASRRVADAVQALLHP